MKHLVKNSINLVPIELFRLTVIIILMACQQSSVIAVPFNTGVETSDKDRGGWLQGIAAYKGHVFFHRILIAEGRKQGYLVHVDPNKNITISDVVYSESIENHSHGGDIMVDGIGRIHIIYGASPGHEDSDGLHHLVSSKPLNVNSKFYMGKGFPDGIAGTYRHYENAPNGDLYAFIKSAPEDFSRGEGQLWHWNNHASTWNKVAVVNAMDGKTTYTPWLTTDNKGNVHLSWIWGDGPRHSPNRHIGSYALYKPATGKFYKANGSEYKSMPITPSSADAWQPIEPDRSWKEPEIRRATMQLDHKIRPVIKYHYIENQSRFVHWNGKEWERSIAMKSDIDGRLSVRGSTIYCHDKDKLHISKDYGKKWETITIAPGLNANSVYKADEKGDVILYFKDKEGPRKDIYIGYINYDDPSIILPLPPEK